ncbi:MAG: IPT/TIG domain-containing protein, partial [Chloroflexota bacterium]
MRSSSAPSSGGQTIELTGANFASGAEVRFGGEPASQVTVVSSERIVAVAPAHAAGAVDVSVRNPDGRSATAV